MGGMEGATAWRMIAAGNGSLGSFLRKIDTEATHECVSRSDLDVGAPSTTRGEIPWEVSGFGLA